MSKGDNMKHSIKKRFAIVFIGLMSAVLLLCWFLNGTFLEKYYITNKVRVLKEAYATINNAASTGDITSDTFDIHLRKICGKYNIDMIVMDTDSKTIKSSENDPELMRRQLTDSIFQNNPNLRDFSILEETQDYTIQNVTDPRTQTGFIEIWGILETGDFVMIRSAIEGIKDSVMIANRFLAYVGVFSIALGGLVIWFVTKKVTDPILKLAEISERMAHLDFEARYDVADGNDEVAHLGRNINQLSQTLEEAIAELKTANNELQNDIAKKEKIDEMRKEFLSNVSHELKTPIALIQGYAEGLQEGVGRDPESMNFYCEVIVDESHKMNEMVKKLLNLNQLEFGNDIVEMERFNITELITSFVQSADILIKQNGIRVELPNYPEIYVWGDEFKVEEVVSNYFSNAINHCSGEKKIRISIEREDKSVRVSVFNTGHPIPESSLEFLWDKFYKVDKARTREYGGSGVGLSIVKAIMESMNQKYGVQNHTDGVEFWFQLATE